MCKSSNIFFIYLFANIATLRYEKLHSLAIKKTIISNKILFLLDRVFSELLGTNFNPSFLSIEVGLKIFLIYTLDMLVAFESRVFTHCSCCWGPL